MALLNDNERKDAGTRLKDWAFSQKSIRRTYTFKDFVEAIRFVDQMAILAEEAWHHPDIDIRWNKVSLELSTHDEGGLTVKDVDLAVKLDALRSRM